MGRTITIDFRDDPLAAILDDDRVLVLVRARRARTLAGLRARAAWMAERSAVSGLDETDVLVAFAREVAAFGRAGA